jgi:hypothetical protein
MGRPDSHPCSSAWRAPWFTCTLQRHKEDRACAADVAVARVGVMIAATEKNVRIAIAYPGQAGRRQAAAGGRPGRMGASECVHAGAGVTAPHA